MSIGAQALHRELHRPGLCFAHRWCCRRLKAKYLGQARNDHRAGTAGTLPGRVTVIKCICLNIFMDKKGKKNIFQHCVRQQVTEPNIDVKNLHEMNWIEKLFGKRNHLIIETNYLAFFIRSSPPLISLTLPPHPIS